MPPRRRGSLVGTPLRPAKGAAGTPALPGAAQKPPVPGAAAAPPPAGSRLPPVRSAALPEPKPAGAAAAAGAAGAGGGGEPVKARSGPPRSSDGGDPWDPPPAKRARSREASAGAARRGQAAPDADPPGLSGSPDGGGGGAAQPIPFRWRGQPRELSGALTAPARVLVVSPEDRKQNAALVRKVLARVQDSLGKFDPGMQPGSKLFLAVARSAAGPDVVCGALVAEELSRARRMVDRGQEEAEEAALRRAARKAGSGATQEQVALAVTESLPQANSSGLSASAEEDASWAGQAHFESNVAGGEGVICGVSRIWVDAAFRRRGVATQMVDAARRNLVFGYQIPREHCAFSQPTRDGKLLAKQLSGRRDFFVYS